MRLLGRMRGGGGIAGRLILCGVVSLLGAPVVASDGEAVMAQAEGTAAAGPPPEALGPLHERLRAVLEEQGMATAVEYDVRELGDGLWVVRAVQPGSYPGSGVAAAVLDTAGVSHGAHGDRDLADLIRQRGWSDAPPAPELLLGLLDAAYFEGIGSTRLAEPGVEARTTGLMLHFEQFTPPGPAHPWQAWIPADPADGGVQLYLELADGSLRQVR